MGLLEPGEKVGLMTLLILAGAFIVFWQPPIVHSQTDDRLGLSYGAESGLTSTDARSVTASVISVVLSLLGTVCVVIVLYAGFLWMTAAGNEENIKKAKEILGGGIIGLLIILSAYSITRFVTRETYYAATGENYRP